jgi:gluconolactonase
MASRSKFVTRISGFLSGIALAALIGAPAAAQAPANGIPGVVAANTPVELVSEVFENTEGPLGAPDGGLFFSDTNANRTYRLDPQGRISVYRENTDRGNGIAMYRDGTMIWAEERRISTKDLYGGGYRSIIGNFRVFQPNDLIATAKGGVYFTDPGPRPVVPGLKVNVYYLDPFSTTPVVVDDSVARPNGVMLSNDERTLYVADTVGTSVFAYDVQPDGKLTNKRPFAGLQDIQPGQEGFGDGLAVDRNDNLYVAALTGVQIFDKTGKYLGTIKVPRQPSNVAFAGPDKKVLYITARQGLYKIQMQAQGPARLGK